MTSITADHMRKHAHRLSMAGIRVNVKTVRACSGNAGMAIISKTTPVLKIRQKYAARMKPTVWMPTASMMQNVTKASAKRPIAQPVTIYTTRRVSPTRICIAAVTALDAQPQKPVSAPFVFAKREPANVAAHASTKRRI